MGYCQPQGSLSSPMSNLRDDPEIGSEWGWQTHHPPTSTTTTQLFSCEEAALEVQM